MKRYSIYRIAKQESFECIKTVYDHFNDIIGVKTNINAVYKYAQAYNTNRTHNGKFYYIVEEDK